MITNLREWPTYYLMEATQASFDYYELENPMGERRKDALRVNPGAPGLKVEFHGTKVTSDADKPVVSLQLPASRYNDSI
jgi:hypothetical protein